jgi:hypothetical protein
MGEQHKVPSDRNNTRRDVQCVAGRHGNNNFHTKKMNTHNG